MNYSTEVSVEPLTLELGKSVELRCGVSQSSLSQWRNSVTSNGSRLTWSEGGVTSLVAGRELVYNDAAGEVVLRISNFSIEDYGVYRCQCVNNFSYLQYEVCGRHEGLPTHCTATREVKLLPSGPGIYVCMDACRTQ